MKVNYIKKHDKNGTSYNQTITIPFNMAWDFNEYIDKLKEETQEKFLYTSEDLKIMDYLEKINFYNPTFATLTTVKYFIEFYKKYYINTPKKDQFFERLKYRNTCFVVTSNAEK